MRFAITRRLQQAALIVAIIVGGLVMGALTPAYSHAAAAGPTSAASIR